MLTEKLEKELCRLVDALEKHEPGTPTYDAVTREIEALDMVRDRELWREHTAEHTCSCEKTVIEDAVNAVFEPVVVGPETVEEPVEEAPKPKKTRKKKVEEPVVEEPVPVEEPVDTEEPEAEPVEEYTFLQVREMCIKADKSLPAGAMAELIAKYTPAGKQPKLSAILPDSYPAFVKDLKELSGDE